ncbi:hypothetical protein C2S52_006571 [Perilla frutescens var. hirtella]|nr:hypothetical protein C2S52_006571 [Perilla frutescens var. hirtella]
MPLPSFFSISLLSTIIIITATNFTHSYSQCLDHQKTLLLELKNELIFDSSVSEKLVQWNQTDDCCNWYGVDCDGAGNVITLQLDIEGISGGIGDSSSLFKLKYLEKLNLAFNDIDYTQIPKQIRALTNLTHLNFSNAGFAGQVPVELSSLRRLVSLDISGSDWNYKPLKLEYPNLEMLVQNLTGLRELNLDNINISSQKNEWSHIISSYLPDLMSLSLCDCSLSGPLDTSLLRLHDLSILRLDGNNLSSAIPDFFSNFSSLTTLSLSYCFLKGYFPEMIFHLPTLQNLDLSENHLLNGIIPPFPQNGSSLQSIILSGTNFSGSLPSSLSNLRALSKMVLMFCEFTGSIPSTIANLTELVFVDLSFNFFTGSLSSTFFQGLHNLVFLNLGSNLLTGSIPRSLFGLPSLQVVLLSYNQFENEFPSVNVSSISYLDLRGNRLEGPIPDSLFQLGNLEYLLLSHNLFNGTFPMEKLQSLPNLEVLKLSYNNLFVDTNNVSSTSHYPKLRRLGLASCNLYNFPYFTTHSDVSDVDLSNNRIAGEIPSWIWGIGAQLEVLNLSSNLLTGMQRPFHIPSSLNELDISSNRLRGELHLPIPSIKNQQSSLLFLSLANNSLSGSIPTSLCNATDLSFLDLSLNKLSGDIPPCLLENNLHLEVFNLGRNNISGHIPDNFSLSCRLRSFDLKNNNLQGKIPKSLERCKWLEFMNVGNNIINDTFPCMLSSSLRVLVLRSNRFHGGVRCRNSWPDLQIFDISSNNFSGNLEVINFSSWREMVIENDPQLSHNYLGSQMLQMSSYYYYEVGVRLNMKGLEVELVKIWPEFTALDFSCNNFEGVIPNAIGDLRSLHLLNLSHNALNGSIPESFGKLRNLESLDLSQNQLAGVIPVELAGLTFLSFLNLSFNKLVGVIPNGRQLQTFSADSFEGNPALCGFPLDISCSNNGDDSDSSQPDQSVTEIEWEYVSAALGYVVGLGSLVWLLLFCRSFREKYFDKVDEVVEEIFDGRNRNRRRRCSKKVVRNRVRRQ